MKRIPWIFIAIIIIATSARLRLIGILPSLNGSDELKHVITAKFIAENGLITPPETPVYFTDGMSTLVPPHTSYNNVPYANTVYTKVPVLYHVILSGVFRLLSTTSMSFMDIARQLRLFQTIIGIIGVTCFYFLSKKVLKNTSDVYLATYIYATIPLLILLDATVNWDSALAAVGTLSALSLVATLRKPTMVKTIRTAILLGTAYLLKPTAIYFIGTITSWGIIQKNIRTQLSRILAVTALFLLPFLIQNYHNDGVFIPDPQKIMYQTSNHAPWMEKARSMTHLYIQHISLLYPQNQNNIPKLLEPIRLVLVVIATAGIVLLIIYGATGILRQGNSPLLLFAVAPVVYITIYSILQWPNVPGLAAIPDRSARSFSPLFFSIPMLIVYGLNIIKKKYRRVNKYGSPIMLFFWNILVIQTLFL